MSVTIFLAYTHAHQTGWSTSHIPRKICAKTDCIGTFVSHCLCCTCCLLCSLHHILLLQQSSFCTAHATTPQAGVPLAHRCHLLVYTLCHPVGIQPNSLHTQYLLWVEMPLVRQLRTALARSIAVIPKCASITRLVKL